MEFMSQFFNPNYSCNELKNNLFNLCYSVTYKFFAIYNYEDVYNRC